MERNQRLALALEIKNPDLSSKLGNPTYSQFLKDYARQNPTFVASVEKALSELVTAANQVICSVSHVFAVIDSYWSSFVFLMFSDQPCIYRFRICE